MSSSPEYGYSEGDVPFFELFEYLNTQGFAIDIADFTAAIWMLDKTDLKDKKNRNVLKFQLAAIVSRDQDEQEKFYETFDRFSELKGKSIHGKLIKVNELEQKRKKRILYLISSLLICAIVFFAAERLLNQPGKIAHIAHNKHIIQNESTTFYPIIESGDTLKDITADQDSLYWNFGDKTDVYNELQPKHAFSETGQKIIVANLLTNNQKSSYSDTLTICDKLPDISGLQRNTNVNDDYYLIRSPEDKDKPLTWRVDDKDTTSQLDTVVVKFPKEGNYLVSCRYEKQFCTHRRNEISVSVTDSTGFYLDVDFKDAPSPANSYQLKTYVYVLIVILSIGFLILLFISWFKKNREQDSAAQTELPLFPGAGPPFDILFPANTKLIQEENFYQKWVASLIRPVNSDMEVFNIQRSIRATIHNLGLFTPVYSNKNQKRTYLFIVDAERFNSIQKHLLEHLIEFASSKQVDIDLYYYQGDFNNLRNKDTVQTFDIRNIQSKHYGSSIILCGNGYNFLSHFRASVDDLIKAKLSYWKNRVLLTMVPSLDWLGNEKALANFFHIIPIDSKGMLQIIPLVNGEVYDQRTGNTSLFDTYSTSNIHFEEIKQLEEYIDDEQFFQVVCTLAVYPKISWELLLHVIHGINPQLSTYTRLLKLSRVSWISKNSFPARIRLELLKRLTIENEITTRRILIQLLESIDIPEKEFAANEKKMQLIINKFVLYSNDPEKFPEYKKQEKEFLLLHEAGKIKEIPLKLYLQKNDPDYKTGENERARWNVPLNTARKKDATLDEYASSNSTPRVVDVYPPKQSTLLKVLTLSCILLLGGIITGMMSGWNVFYAKSEDAQVYYKFYLEKDSCYKVFNPIGIGISGGMPDKGTVSFQTKDSLIYGPLTKTPSEPFCEIKAGNSRGQTLTWTGIVSTANGIIHIRGCKPVPPQPDTLQTIVKLDSIRMASFIRTTNPCISNPVFQLNAEGRKGNQIVYYNERLKDTVLQLKKCIEERFKKGFALIKDPTSNQKIMATIYMATITVDTPVPPDCKTEYLFFNMIDDDSTAYLQASDKQEKEKYTKLMIAKLKQNGDFSLSISSQVKEPGQSQTLNIQHAQALAKEFKNYVVTNGIDESRIQVGTSYLISSTRKCIKEVDIRLKRKFIREKIKIQVSDEKLLDSAKNFAASLGNDGYDVQMIQINNYITKSEINYGRIGEKENVLKLKEKFIAFFKTEISIKEDYKTESGVTINIFSEKAVPVENDGYDLVDTLSIYLGGNEKVPYVSMELEKKYGVSLSRINSNRKNESSTFEISKKQKFGAAVMYPPGIPETTPENFVLRKDEERSFTFDNQNLKISITCLGLQKNGTGNPASQATKLEIKVYKKRSAALKH